MTTASQLRRLLQSGEIVMAPGAPDAITARLVQKAGFPAVYMTGFGATASRLGTPDIGLLSQTEMTGHARDMVRAVDIPVIADADTGYGNELNTVRTVQEYERRGVAGFHIEDQEIPKRCGHLEDKVLVPLDDYLAKIRAAVGARRNPDFLVIARTDSSDLDDIARRVVAFAEAGADAVLVDGLKSLDTVRDLSKRVDRPFCFNQIAGGKSPACTQSALRDAGVSLVIYSTPCLFAAQAAIDDAMATLKATDGTLADSRIGVSECTRVLDENLVRRDRRSS